MILKNKRFIDQVAILERILSGSVHRPQQLVYKYTMRSDPLDLEVTFPYLAHNLWTFHSDKVLRKSVSAIAINTKNPDVIAVGHGKFFYRESDKGFICIWCVKNTKYPERFYKFQSTVTCLDFAMHTPNVLAAGFLDGSLLLLDSSSLEKKVRICFFTLLCCKFLIYDIINFSFKVLLTKDSVFCNTYDTIIYIKWWIFVDIFRKQEERLMMTTADGRVIQLRRREDLLVPFQMMRISKSEGKVCCFTKLF